MKKILLLCFTCLAIAGCNQATTTENGDPIFRVKPGSVYDGDTFQVINAETKEEFKIRLSCIDAPELKQDGGKQSRNYLRKMLKNNRQVILKSSGRDKYDRNLAEVYLPLKDGDQIAVNQEMVKAGYAHYYSYFNCPGNSNAYQQLEESAIANKDGIWREESVERPWDWRKRNKER